jgi:ferric-dicitrate binding protein FerR (iron transport regulator)
MLLPGAGAIMAEHREHHEQVREIAQEKRRAWSLQERLNKELDDLDDSLSRMRRAARPLPPDPHPGPAVPIEHRSEGG